MPLVPKKNNEFERIPFRLHPRVFAALGADLVTNDVVAVIELVKNSYDAFSSNVWIRFASGKDGYIEIEDDGQGMTRKTIENVWCLVATPFKANNPWSKIGNKKRRVVGEKGLGRLSVARLGENLQMLTKCDGEECLEVKVDWTEISTNEDISDCAVECRVYQGVSPFKKSGTRLRINNPRGIWDEDRILDLEENLSRLISPFSPANDFKILMSRPGATDSEMVQIQIPKFLSEPKYSISGTSDQKGNIECRYSFHPIGEGQSRTKSRKLSWEQVYDGIQEKTRFPFQANQAQCGSFSFEIRAWDIGPDDTQEIADRFEFRKGQIRKAIRAHKGISVYRDKVLVLPKSENTRDWLGLDLRRVSRVGTRLSTSQLVGYVSISADENPNIGDTSDRERLVSTRESAEFEFIIKAVVELMEIERDADRVKRDKQKPINDLFDSISVDSTMEEILALVDEGAELSEALPALRNFSAKLEIAKKEIQERFFHYSRLATIGTIAQMLVHEIRNKTGIYGSFLDFIKSRFSPFKEKGLEEEYRSADQAVNSLEQLASTFAPLASRAFRRRQRDALLEERIRICLDIQLGDLKRKGIICHVPKSETRVAVDPGELDAILHNLISNAAYWLGQVSIENREIDFRLTTMDGGRRIRIWVHDSGPGLQEEDVEKVFLPGVTRRPGGIGMGLTVASELVAEYGGGMQTKHPGTKGGASFGFDLPLK